MLGLYTLLAVCIICRIDGGLPPDEYSDNYPDESYGGNTTTEQDIRNAITNTVDRIDPKFIPVNDHSEALKLKVDFTLLSLTNFDEISGQVDIVASFIVSWKGSNLPTWDPERLGGKSTHAVNANDIWTPKLLLLNPAHIVTNLAAFSDRVRITSNGTAHWQIISGIQASCSVNVGYFPFDKQECDINIAMWGYDTHEVVVIGTLVNADKMYVENSAWLLRDVAVEGVNSEVTPFLKATLFIDRYHEYFLINVLLPPTLLSILSPCVFLLPAASGERMSFAVTCFLAFGVFMSLLSDNMPKSSVPVARLSYFMMYMLIHSCAVTFCTILSLRVYTNDNTPDTVPGWLQFFIKALRLTHCRNRCQTGKSCSVNPDGTTSVGNIYNTGSIKRRGTIDFIKRRETIDITTPEDVQRRYMTTSAKKESFIKEQQVTWYTVGRTLDAFFFVVFLGWMLFTSITSYMALRLT